MRLYSRGRNGIRQARKALRQKTGQACRFEPGRGKGSHGRLYVGENFTTVKRGEIGRNLFYAMLKQLQIEKEDF